MQRLWPVRVSGTTRLPNTPTAGMGTSPAQRLMGRRCKTLQTLAGKLLQPRCDAEGEACAPLGAKQRKQFNYNQHTKPLEEKSPGETVRVKLPGNERWTTKWTCAEALDHRSYLVIVGNTQYRRNRRHLLKMSEPSHRNPGEDIKPTQPTREQPGEGGPPKARVVPIWVCQTGTSVAQGLRHKDLVLPTWRTTNKNTINCA